MSLTLRRTAATDPTRDVELLHTLDVEALHGLLHRRGEADLAAALLLRLTPEGAGDLAALLARFRRRHSRSGLFRSYARLLDVEGARQVDLAVAFLRGAAHAGCRVYPDPNSDARTITQITPPQNAQAAPPQPLYALPPADSRDESVAPGVGSDEGERARRIMPPWLSVPHGSSWDR